VLTQLVADALALERHPASPRTLRVELVTEGSVLHNGTPGQRCRSSRRFPSEAASLTKLGVFAEFACPCGSCSWDSVVLTWLAPSARTGTSTFTSRLCPVGLGAHVELARATLADLPPRAAGALPLAAVRAAWDLTAVLDVTGERLAALPAFEDLLAQCSSDEIRAATTKACLEHAGTSEGLSRLSRRRAAWADDQRVVLLDTTPIGMDLLPGFLSPLLLAHRLERSTLAVVPAFLLDVLLDVRAVRADAVLVLDERPSDDVLEALTVLTGSLASATRADLARAVEVALAL
jgi:hypothetical protein